MCGIYALNEDMSARLYAPQYELNRLIAQPVSLYATSVAMHWGSCSLSASLKPPLRVCASKALGGTSSLGNCRLAPVNYSCGGVTHVGNA